MIKNKRGQKSVFGLIFVVMAFLFIITQFGLIDVLIETLNTVRGGSELNCPGTVNFDQTDYDNDTTLEKLTRRPTCFATGFFIVYFVGAFLIGVVVWTMNNWRKISR